MNDYKYEIGHVVNGLEITGRTTKIIQVTKQGKTGNRLVKSYTYKCLTCGYSCGEYYNKGKHFDSYSITENGLSNGNGCFLCAKNGAVAPNINSIKATAPWMIKYLVNEEDAVKYSPQSTKILDFNCPDCGKHYKRKCYKTYQYKVPCTCGDCFSYPEKFMFSTLYQLGIDFETQYYIDGSNYRYDFYVKDINTIIEVNGIQHYKTKWKYRSEPDNDINKKSYAYAHGFSDDTYLVLDCHESNLDFIRNAILSSKLSAYFDLSVVDFNKCSEFATSNLAKVACEYWNNGMNVQEISEIMKIDKHTAMKYLRQGNDSKWCVYNPGCGVERYSSVRANRHEHSSGVTGVTWHKGSSSWAVRITVNKRRILVCHRKNIQDAIHERLLAEIKYFGYENAPQKHLFETYGIKPISSVK